jgi:diguanylate cyclase (GGDEF)-like protein
MIANQDSQGLLPWDGGSDDGDVPSGAMADPPLDEPAQDPAAPLLPEPNGWSDSLSGAEGPRYWDRLLTGEQARLRRYRGGATIVLIELAGFDELATWVGPEPSVQYFARLARLLAGEVRTSDHFVRITRNRFAVLLVQTDEIQTLNFVDRLQLAFREELGGTRNPLRLGIGWASPEQDQDLSAAMATAETRLADDLSGTTG